MNTNTIASRTAIKQIQKSSFYVGTHCILSRDQNIICHSFICIHSDISWRICDVIIGQNYHMNDGVEMRCFGL